MTDEEKARRLDPIALLAVVDEGAGKAYRDELKRRLDAMRERRRKGT